MTCIKELPDAILENIRQFIGNCRIYNGEFIMTLDKKSDEFMNMECLIKKRLDNMKFTIIDLCTIKDLGFEVEDHPPWNPNNPYRFFGLDEINTIHWTESWAVVAQWKQDRLGYKYRTIIYKYYHPIDTLFCLYKRRATQSDTKESKRCMEEHGYFTDTGYSEIKDLTDTPFKKMRCFQFGI